MRNALEVRYIVNKIFDEFIFFLTLPNPQISKQSNATNLTSTEIFSQTIQFCYKVDTIYTNNSTLKW